MATTVGAAIGSSATSVAVLGSPAGSSGNPADPAVQTWYCPDFVTPGHAESRDVLGRVGDPVALVDADGTTAGAAARVAGALLEHLATTGAEPGAGTVVVHPDHWLPGAVAALRGELATRLPHAHLVPAAEAVLAWSDARSPLTAGPESPEAAVLVLDLGATGTTTLLLRAHRDADGTLTLRDRGGARRREELSGDGTDLALLRHVLAGVELPAPLDQDDPATRAALLRLRAACREAKETLSADTETVVAVELPGTRTRVRVVREELAELLAPALAAVLEDVADALAEDDLHPADLDRVVLVGGGSAVPMVAERLSDVLSRPVQVEPAVGRAAAEGAALLAAARPVDGPAPAEEPPEADLPFGAVLLPAGPDEALRSRFTRPAVVAATPSWRERNAPRFLVALVAATALTLGGVQIAQHYEKKAGTTSSPVQQAGAGGAAGTAVEAGDGSISFYPDGRVGGLRGSTTPSAGAPGAPGATSTSAGPRPTTSPGAAPAAAGSADAADAARSGSTGGGASPAGSGGSTGSGGGGTGSAGGSGSTAGTGSTGGGGSSGGASGGGATSAAPSVVVNPPVVVDTPAPAPEPTQQTVADAEQPASDAP